MPKDPDGVAWAGPALVALVMVASAVVALVVLFRPGSPERFAADHGVSPLEDVWLRCAAETIERHPGPFAAQEGFEIEAVESGRFLVRSALLTTEVVRADQSLHYWRFKGWHIVPLDCPEARPT